MLSSITQMLPSLALAIALTADVTSAATVKCATSVHLVAARGQGPGDDWNVLTQLRDPLLKAIPGSTAYALPYDHAGSNKFADVQSGANLLKSYIADYHKSCPNAKIVTFGYSLGGVVVMDATCGSGEAGSLPVTALDPSYADVVIGVITIGEETYLPMMPWNTGTCTFGPGYSPRFGALIQCAPFRDSLQDYCDTGDYECCVGSGLPSNNGNPVHHTYFKKYTKSIIAFVQKRLAETT